MFSRLQRFHFWALTVGPIPVAALAILFRPTAIDLALFGVFWFATAIGTSLGNHRLFSHRAFEPRRGLRAVIAVLACMAGEGPPISWAAFHRRHHQASDRPGDPHSPLLHGSGFAGRLRGIAHAMLTWMREHDYPNPAVYVPDLLKDRDLVWINSRYFWFVGLGAALPAVIGGAASGSMLGAVSGFVWGWGVRAFVLNTTIGFVNTFNHLVGERRFATRDNSRNMAWLAVPTLGEAWHNNHHAFPGSANMALDPRGFDIGYWIILGWKALGLVEAVSVPDAERVARRRRRDAEANAEPLAEPRA